MSAGRPPAVVTHDLDQRLGEAGAVLAGRDALPFRHRVGEEVGLGRRRAGAGGDGHRHGDGTEGGHREVETRPGVAGGGQEEARDALARGGREGHAHAARVAAQAMAGERRGAGRRQGAAPENRAEGVGGVEGRRQEEVAQGHTP